MEYRILGRTGIKVSAIGIGGEGFENRSYEDCEEMIDYAIRDGINFIDIYNSNPEVRSNVGKALNRYPRDSYVVEGHIGSAWENGQYKRTRDMKEVVNAYEDFLHRMRLNYVDIGMIHFVDQQKDFDNIFNGPFLQYVLELKEKGIIRSIGMSTHNPDIALLAVDSGIVDVILFSINAAYDMLPANEDMELLFSEDTYKNRYYEGIDPKRDRLYRICQNEGVALTVMKGYGAGVLLNEKISPFGKAMTPVQCLHYCLTRPAVASVMVGAADTDQIHAAISYNTADSKARDYTSVLANTPRRAFSGHCMYCGHCAPCSKKIDIALVNKYLDLAAIQAAVPETLRNHYDVLEHQASECIECGSCMKNCPFGVDVISKMKKAAILFGK
jgi:predicted aldo/keto reductase-like oxidoreductase